MASVKVAEIVRYFRADFEVALAAALNDGSGVRKPNADFNQGGVYNTFLKKLVNNLSTWETVPDDFVSK